MVLKKMRKQNILRHFNYSRYSPIINEPNEIHTSIYTRVLSLGQDSFPKAK